MEKGCGLGGSFRKRMDSEILFAQADIIEQAGSVSLRHVEQMDQSILARAFRGELE